MAVLQPNVIEILIPGYRSADVAVTFWDTEKANYELNDKVAYLGEIYNVDAVPIPAGTLPTDEDFWRQISSGAGGIPDGGTVGQIIVKQADGSLAWEDNVSSLDPVRGGAAPADYDPADAYVENDRVSLNNKEYRCLTNTTGVFDPTDWVEVGTQNNEERIAVLEATSTGSVINEYSFTETTNDAWTVTNAGLSQVEFDTANREFFRDGVKLRKGAEIVWVSDSEVTINLTSVVNENYLDIRVTTTASIAPDPTENEYSQTVPANGVWTVTGIGDSLSEFNSAKIQIYYGGIKMRKGSQAVWVSPTELRVQYTSIINENFLTIRNDV